MDVLKPTVNDAEAAEERVLATADADVAQLIADAIGKLDIVAGAKIEALRTAVLSLASDPHTIAPVLAEATSWRLELAAWRKLLATIFRVSA